MGGGGGRGGGLGGPTILLYMINSECILAKSWSSCTKMYCTQNVRKLEISRKCVLNADYAISSYLK